MFNIVSYAVMYLFMINTKGSVKGKRRPELYFALASSNGKA